MKSDTQKNEPPAATLSVSTPAQSNSNQNPGTSSTGGAPNSNKVEATNTKPRSF